MTVPASQVGALYAPENNRRADAFQVYYIGINAGVIILPLICVTLGEKVGWRWRGDGNGRWISFNESNFVMPALTSQSRLPRECNLPLVCANFSHPFATSAAPSDRPSSLRTATTFS
ncbi:hypothetical protein EAH84_14865 [Sphingomonas oligophenolica]|uniref:MFS transporter n=1 Tax=Sphingomonas oligophenolica TaxID=301154 RepID=A0A502C179_9SPHN|nr:hypothetical protein EAH84_14865 [Sphingomonas oligophenolica]